MKTISVLVVRSQSDSAFGLAVSALIENLLKSKEIKAVTLSVVNEAGAAVDVIGEMVFDVVILKEGVDDLSSIATKANQKNPGCKIFRFGEEATRENCEMVDVFISEPGSLGCFSDFLQYWIVEKGEWEAVCEKMSSQIKRSDDFRTVVQQYEDLKAIERGEK